MHREEVQEYKGITPEHFAALEALAQKHNYSIIGNAGRVQKDGFDCEWSYVEADQTLTIKVHSSPFWAPESLIERHFESWIEQTDPKNTATGPVESAQTDQTQNS